jgi:hypothetical protein
VTESNDVVTLREYVDIRFEAQAEAVKSALASADRAVAKAEAASDKRFDAVNEFRASLNDNTRTLLPRAEAEQAFKAINEKLEQLTSRVNTRDDRGQGMSDIWGYIVGAIGILALIISYLRGAHA